MHKLSTILVLAVFSSLFLHAQPYKDSRYGVDSLSRMKCAEQLSTLSEYMKINLFDYALDAFQHTITNCPASSKNIYIHGVRIYKHLIEKEKDPSIRSRKVDSLMLIYDLRMQYFNEEGVVMGRKGLDMLKYSNDVGAAYTTLQKSIGLLQEKAEDAVLVNAMQASLHLRKTGGMTEADYLANYSSIIALLEKRMLSDPTDEKSKTTLENIHSIFAAGDPTDCNSLQQLFGEDFEKNKNDKEWIKRVLSLLEGSKCQDSPLYAHCAEQNFTLEPLSDGAFQLYSIFAKQKDYTKAKEYIQKAIELEQDPVKKSRNYLAYAQLLGFENSQYKEARAQAQEAIKLNPNWGDPYLFIGNLYVSSSKMCGSNEFEQKAVFWLAVDWYQKAKANDPNAENDANRLIEQYSKYFPNKETAFFQGFTEGNSYTCGCWINETTRVRF